jgi:sulfur carrier protein ThiS
MANVTIRYGLTNSVTRSFDEGVTVGDLLQDRSIRAALSAPEAVVAVSNGDTLRNSDLIEDYDSITLEQQASSKA